MFTKHINGIKGSLLLSSFLDLWGQECNKFTVASCMTNVRQPDKLLATAWKSSMRLASAVYLFFLWFHLHVGHTHLLHQTIKTYIFSKTFANNFASTFSLSLTPPPPTHIPMQMFAYLYRIIFPFL